MEANADDEAGDDDDDYDNESNGDEGTQANDAANVSILSFSLPVSLRICSLLQAIDMSVEMQVDGGGAATSNNAPAS